MAIPIKRINGKAVDEGFDDEVSRAHGQLVLDDQPTPDPLRRAQDVIILMKENLFHLGKKRALERGDLKKNQEVAGSLTEHAEAMAREVSTEEFDPSKNEHDRPLKEEYEEIKRKREEAEHTEKFAEAAVRNGEEALASLQSDAEEPVAPRWLMIAAVIVLAITIAPTLHDFIFITMEDDMLNWFLSILSASFIGTLITVGILGDIDSTGRRSAANWTGLIGGIVICIGLGILRAAQASDWNEVVFATALTVVEIGCILMMEWRAAALRSAFGEWSERQEKIKLAKEHLNACRSNLGRCQNRLKKINNDIQSYIAYVQDRWVRHNNINAIVDAAIKSVLDGYDAGIAINIGYVEGSAGRIQ